jgi:predicted enzyme related to lactoylglutathione lyase
MADIVFGEQGTQALVDGMVARLCALGATLDREIKVREYGRIANMTDPFGNGFDLIEFSGSSYEAVSRL